MKDEGLVRRWAERTGNLLKSNFLIGSTKFLVFDWFVDHAGSGRNRHNFVLLCSSNIPPQGNQHQGTMSQRICSEFSFYRLQYPTNSRETNVFCTFEPTCTIYM